MRFFSLQDLVADLRRFLGHLRISDIIKNISIPNRKLLNVALIPENF